MKKATTIKMIAIFLFVIGCCNTFEGCKKNLTPEERKKNLETKISENDCKEITTDALRKILENLRDVKFENALHGVEEDIRNFSKENNYYISVVVYGTAKGVYKGVDSDYSFYLYGRIPENIADKKEFDENGYNLFLKKNGVFVYSNKDNVDALNREKAESLKKGEEMRKKDFVIGDTKVQYNGKEGNSLVYSSGRELTPNEIADAIQNKIESEEGVDMIQFYSGLEKYAYYIYSTQCIIYVKYPDEIYKIIGGIPEKV